MPEKHFAIFTGANVWNEEVDALSLLLDGLSMTYELVNAVQINRGILMEAGARRFRSLIMPGGNVYPRCFQLLKEGKDNIRSFIESGGTYLGFCAGAYFAATTVVNAEKATGGNGTFNQATDYTTYHHDLALFDGIAEGPVGWAPFTHFGMDFEPVQLASNHPVLQAIGMPDEGVKLFGQGGPFFTPRKKPSGYRVWARAVRPEGCAEGAATGDGKPTIISFDYGSGSVILSSYHPATTSRYSGNDERYHSLNLLFAMLRLSIGEPVEPLNADENRAKLALALGSLVLA